MTAARELVSIVETAYQLEPDEPEWLEGLVSQLRGPLDAGLGLGAFFFERTARGKLRFTKPIVVGAPASRGLALSAALKLLPSRMVNQAFGTPLAMASASQVFGLGDALRDHFLVKRFGHPFGFHDMLGFKVHDANGAGLLVVAALSEIRAVAPRESEVWAMCAAHVGAALRLRRNLGARGFEGAEAVLETNGSLAHAEGHAKKRDARAALREAVLASERARGPLRRSDPDEALELWQALVAGRWSIVEHFDSDGHRYLVARKNDPDVRDPRGLSLRERQVVAYAVLGHSTKLIGYELGISASTAATHLTNAMTKLGVSTRAELMQRVGARR